ncbi:hypothetical protein PISMIDRAFT_420769 [Pisolithus microcarpus 441]|uniref:Unplaced genomic scaffold scaffold_36, whole genome shotgun sequence n=1 Tax=Pisolithus microcarpus 441 TaxID=765257 RepID=A0A0C9ZDM5_9AGAM|nr:hypothetical protein BKA83DRAFT_420769 [Pisolithus microcarpus]KIK24004.1 hypothetical protein PISMIDRAFT_420769 [Pisolithus microcarpus 441]
MRESSPVVERRYSTIQLVRLNPRYEVAASIARRSRNWSHRRTSRCSSFHLFSCFSCRNPRVGCHLPETYLLSILHNAAHIVCLSSPIGSTRLQPALRI